LSGRQEKFLLLLYMKVSKMPSKIAFVAIYPKIQKPILNSEVLSRLIFGGKL